LLLRFKKLGSSGFELSVGDVKIGAGLGFLDGVIGLWAQPQLKKKLGKNQHLYNP